MPETPRTTATGESALARTATALRIAWGRWDARLAVLVAGVLYFLVYLVTVGDLSVIAGTGGSFRIHVIEDLSRALASRGFFRFDAIAIVSAGPVTYLLSPLNLVVAVGLSSLVGANMGLTYLGLVQPRACGLESSTGVIAGIPALLSGAACCGPTILLVVGVQASASLISVFQLLLPIAVVLLAGSLLVIGRRIDPALL